MRIPPKVTGVVVMDAGEGVGRKEQLSEACAAEAGTGCERRTLHLDAETAFVSAVCDHILGLAVKGVGGPAGAGDKGEAFCLQHAFYGRKDLAVKFDIAGSGQIVVGAAFVAKRAGRHQKSILRELFQYAAGAERQDAAATARNQRIQHGTCGRRTDRRLRKADFFAVLLKYIDGVGGGDGAKFAAFFRMLCLGVAVDGIAEEGKKALFREAAVAEFMGRGNHFGGSRIVFKERDFVSFYHGSSVSCKNF